MSRVLPILFNTDMVRAILDGKKTVTRRVIKPQPRISCEGLENECRHEKGFYDMGGNEWACRKCGYGVIPIRGDSWIRAQYQPGDTIYVRETWQECCRNPVHNPIIHDKYCYKASLDSPLYGCIEQCGDICNWRPSIHMPKEAARIWLNVTDVRVERLQDISNEQILEEGCDFETIKHYIKQMPEETKEWIHAAHTVEFSQLWDSIIKKQDLDRYGWAANPWVWVIEFERCEKPEGTP